MVTQTVRPFTLLFPYLTLANLPTCAAEQLVRMPVSRRTFCCHCPAVWLCPFSAVVLPKLYSNSLLVSLNNRAFTKFPDVVLPSFIEDVGGSFLAADRSRTLLYNEPQPSVADDVCVDVHEDSADNL